MIFNFLTKGLAMKKLALLGVTASLFFITSCGDDSSSNGVSSKKQLTTEREKFSYAIGNDIGMSLEPFKNEVDLAVVFQGISDNANGKPSLIDEADAKAVKETVFKRIAQQKQEEAKKMAEEKKAAGEKFLAENGKKEGVKTTESGLEYEVIEMGKGAKPGPTDNVEVDYVGTTLDGKEFDSSIKRGKPATFRVDRVIKGWTEGLQLMPEGSKFKFYIPSDLAYGERGAGRDIGPNEVLIFEVTLHKVMPDTTAKK